MELINLLSLAAMGSVLILVISLIFMLRQSHRKIRGMEKALESITQVHQGSETILRQEFGQARRESLESAGMLRKEVSSSVHDLGQSLLGSFAGLTNAQKGQLEMFANQLRDGATSQQKALADVKSALESGLREMRRENTEKLEEMRRTVDEKLEATMEKRLRESFSLVSERLEIVHKGLGEMQSLATGVGDLKRVLTNVKVRGGWGEVQLGSILEQSLAPDQFDKNVSTKKSGERVEFAIKMPGHDDGQDVVWLPIDAKFPLEDYERLQEARAEANAAATEEALKGLEQRLKGCARDIRDKYVNPPNTTDFAILFLPTEGLYAEVLQRPGLAQKLQQDFRICVAGPTTLTALLNSLQMGFRTLAIQKRSSEVWVVLGTVKHQFAQFSTILAKVQKKLQEASNVMDQAASKSRNIERKLQKVEEHPVEGGRDKLGVPRELFSLDG